jgi:signal recognition particle receptor subunit beta
LLREAKPRGIVFMIDSNNPIAHKDAFNFTLQMIEEEIVAAKNLKVFMVLVNKSDLWGDEKSMDEVLEDYRPEMRRLNHQAQKMGYKVFTFSTSLKTGEGVKDAMDRFFNKIRPSRAKAA